MNIILVAIDTLSARHMSCYGYRKPTTPNLDAFAARAVRRSTASAHAANYTTTITGQRAIPASSRTAGTTSRFRRALPDRAAPGIGYQSASTTCR